MYGGDQPNLQLKCVPTARMAIMTGDSIEDGRFKKSKTYSSYVVYVAYRLEPGGSISHQAKLSRQLISQKLSQGDPIYSLNVADNEIGAEARYTVTQHKLSDVSYDLSLIIKLLQGI